MSIGLAVILKEDFSIIRETLERIGIRNNKTKKFYPSCYCLPTKDPNIYKIVHFKELFSLYNKESTFDENDLLRQKTIVQLLSNWNLVEPVNEIDAILTEKIKVLKKYEKKDYEIIHKFKFTKKLILD
jgi:hypothetical protein